MKNGMTFEVWQAFKKAWFESVDGQEMVKEKIQEHQQNIDEIKQATLDLKQWYKSQPPSEIVDNTYACVMDSLQAPESHRKFMQEKLWITGSFELKASDFHLSSLVKQEQELKKWSRLLIPSFKLVPDRNRPQWDIPALKAKPIEDLYAFEKQRASGNKIMTLCPFHEESSASFAIFTDDNHFKCFGCGLYGDNIKFLMELNDWTFVEACKSLASI
jgi:hypothetical protein